MLQSCHLCNLLILIKKSGEATFASCAGAGKAGKIGRCPNFLVSGNDDRECHILAHVFAYLAAGARHNNNMRLGIWDIVVDLSDVFRQKNLCRTDGNDLLSDKSRAVHACCRPGV